MGSHKGDNPNNFYIRIIFHKVIWNILHKMYVFYPYLQKIQKLLTEMFKLETKKSKDAI